ncbi:MAG: hypothetical protein OXH82_06575 [Candidatus Dadabacteria bacterium]|nr:hypothetical protein [Candidatus Dadabacteria bacterium]MDE0663569.1 hypothetical protein [Candidatus Dadabacteria bacterium]
MKYFTALALIAAAILLVQVPAFASGSASAGDGASPRSDYAKGKAITFSKLVCDTCAMQKADLNSESAATLRDGLGEMEGLSSEEKELVSEYLTRRYKL